MVWSCELILTVVSEVRNGTGTVLDVLDRWGPRLDRPTWGPCCDLYTLKPLSLADHLASPSLT